MAQASTSQNVSHHLHTHNPPHMYVILSMVYGTNQHIPFHTYSHQTPQDTPTYPPPHTNPLYHHRFFQCTSLKEQALDRASANIVLFYLLGLIWAIFRVLSSFLLIAENKHYKLYIIGKSTGRPFKLNQHF